MPDDLVLVREFHDEQEASVFIKLLASEGITASAPGLAHRGMLGMVGTYITIPVRVPRDDVERANELLTLMLSEAETTVEDGPATYRDAPPRKESEQTPRRRFIAVFAAFVFPFGGGQFYARAYPTLVGSCSGWLV